MNLPDGHSDTGGCPSQEFFMHSGFFEDVQESRHQPMTDDVTKRWDAAIVQGGKLHFLEAESTVADFPVWHHERRPLGGDGISAQGVKVCLDQSVEQCGQNGFHGDDPYG